MESLAVEPAPSGGSTTAVELSPMQDVNKKSEETTKTKAITGLEDTNSNSGVQDPVQAQQAKILQLQRELQEAEAEHERMCKRNRSNQTASLSCYSCARQPREGSTILLDVNPNQEQVLMELLQREVELRLAPETQAEMERAEQSVNTEWMDCVANLQECIVFQHNQSLDTPLVTVRDLRLAALCHPEIAFWVKYNRARNGTLRVGDTAPNVPLVVARNEQPTTLLRTKHATKPTVVIAGSWS
jgi:hypothetical protein